MLMENISKVAKVLSDENRVKIIALLMREKELCVCEICDTLNLLQPLVSRHLKMMKEAEIIESKKEGKWSVYKLKEHPMIQCIKQYLKMYTLPKLKVCKKRCKNC